MAVYLIVVSYNNAKTTSLSENLTMTLYIAMSSPPGCKTSRTRPQRPIGIDLAGGVNNVRSMDILSASHAADSLALPRHLPRRAGAFFMRQQLAMLSSATIRHPAFQKHPSYDDLRKGQRVTYTEGRGQKGPCAENVKPA